LLTSPASAPIITRCHSLIQRREVPKGSTPFIILGVCLLLVLTLWFDVFSIFQTDEERAILRAAVSSTLPRLSRPVNSMVTRRPTMQSPAAVPSAFSAPPAGENTAPAAVTMRSGSSSSSSSSSGGSSSSSSGGSSSSSSSSSRDSSDSSGSRSSIGGTTPAKWQQHRFRPIGSARLLTFEQFSAYRLSPTQFAVVGLAARAMDEVRKVGDCMWEPAKPAGLGQAQEPRGEEVRVASATTEGSGSRRRRRRLLGEERGEEARREEGRRLEEVEVNKKGWIHGKVEELHVGEHHSLKYAGLILLCTLEREAYVALGGQLHMGMEGEDVVVYEEHPVDVVGAVTHPPFLHNITHCSPPIHGQVNAERVYQWMDVHIRMGVDHYAMYDVGGVDDHLRTAIQPFLDGGIADITDFREVVNYESWYHGQVMIVNDCVYRFRPLSKWIMYLDYDEFIFINGQERMPTPLSVHHFLMPYEGMPYVSHGSLWWDCERCLPSEGPDDPRRPLERMLWHGPGIFCRAKGNNTKASMCLDHYGHRKLFVDPRRVRMVENHVVQEPEGGGADVSTDILRHDHFHGLIKRGIKECTLAMKEHDNITWWARGREEADRMQYVRTHPLNMPYLVASHRWWREFVQRTHQGL
ncbi:hypothetical protein CLOM_g13855, partial [Closterium sp. NIES-68]